MEGDALCVVARAGSDHAALALGFTQCQKFVERAALFEGAGALQVFKLQVERQAGQFGEMVRKMAGRRVDGFPDTGTRRLKAFEPGSTIYKQITEKWKGVEFMACCGNNAKIARKADAQLSYPAQSADVPAGRVRLIYVGPAQATFKVLGKYEVANDPMNNKVDVLPYEANRLLQLGTFVEA